MVVVSLSLSVCLVLLLVERGMVVRVLVFWCRMGFCTLLIGPLPWALGCFWLEDCRYGQKRFV